MDDVTILFIFRAIERIIIIMLGGASMWMGWSLFRNGIIPMQSGEFNSSPFSFKFTKVGPGVFFAAFGMIILSLGLINEMGIKRHREKEESKGNGVYDSSVSTDEYTYFGVGQSNKNKKLIFSINSLNKLSDEMVNGCFSAIQIAEYKDALAVLNSFYTWKMGQIFEEHELHNYANRKEIYEQLKPAEKDVVDNIDEWMKGRIK